MKPVRFHGTGMRALAGVLSVAMIAGALYSPVPVRAEVLRYSLGQSRVRPYLFVDDSAWESMDRSRVLPSQNRAVGTTVPTDPRDYLLRDQLKEVDGSLSQAYGKTVEEVMTEEFLPAFSKLMRMDLGTPQAPVNLLKDLLVAATSHLRESITKIEDALATPSGARHIVFLIAPWEKAPVNDAAIAKLWNRGSRYARGQLGFSSFRRTPTRDFGAKHWIADIDAGEHLSFGQMGNLGHRVRDVAERSSAIITETPYNETPHAIPPYVYPLAFLVHLKIKKGDSDLRIQALLGLQPMMQNLEPAKKSAGAEIDHAGVPQPGPLTEEDTIDEYPFLLIGFDHDLRRTLNTVNLHFDFGVWDSYSSYEHKMKLRRENKAWRMTPYLGGDFVKGNTSSYWTHLRVPVRVHLTEFDIAIPANGSDPQMQNLASAIELFDHEGGKLIPFPTGIQIGFTEGKPTTDAAREIQAAVNDMMKQAFAQAKTGARHAALKKFPLAALFIDR